MFNWHFVCPQSQHVCNLFLTQTGNDIKHLSPLKSFQALTFDIEQKVPYIDMDSIS